MKRFAANWEKLMDDTLQLPLELPRRRELVPRVDDLEPRIEIVEIRRGPLPRIRAGTRQIIPAQAVEIAIGKIDIRNGRDVSAARQVGRSTERIP